MQIADGGVDTESGESPKAELKAKLIEEFPSARNKQAKTPVPDSRQMINLKPVNLFKLKAKKNQRESSGKLVYENQLTSSRKLAYDKRDTFMGYSSSSNNDQMILTR